MFYREAGQFKTSYQADNQIFPLRQDRIGVALLLCAAFFVVPLLASVRGNDINTQELLR